MSKKTTLRTFSRPLGLRAGVSALLAGLVNMAPNVAHAATGGGTLPWEGPLGIVIASLQGPTAYFISVAAMFAAGAALVFGGEMSEFVRKLLLVVVAISLLVFGGKVMTSVFNVSGAVFEAAGAIIG